MEIQPIIEFEHVSKSYGKFNVLNEISLQINQGEFVTIIGPSGCGKTTLLKLINGLVTVDQGCVSIEGIDVAQADQVLLRRNIGYVIQNIGLFPHMTIEENISYVPSLSKLEGWDKKERINKVIQLLKQVELPEEKLHSYPRELSGGQKQRVGIARAIASKPKVLLMDEPFGAVDEIMRIQLQEEILKIHKETNTTILFVTHDISEALKLGTKVLVLEKGKVVQYDQPSKVLKNPATEGVSNLVCRDRVFSPRA